MRMMQPTDPSDRIVRRKLFDQVFDRLCALLAAQRDCLADAARFVIQDMAFHARIAAISGNPILVATSQSMLRWLFQYHGVLLHWSGNEQVTLREHEAITDLIAAHDPDGAVAAMQAHLDRSVGLYAHQNAQG